MKHLFTFFTKPILFFLFILTTACSFPTLECIDDYLLLPFTDLENFFKSTTLGELKTEIRADGSKITYIKTKNSYIIEDVILSKKQFDIYTRNNDTLSSPHINAKAVIGYGSDKWTNNEIFYTFSSQSEEYQKRRDMVKSAMRELEGINPNITFIERANESYYIYITIDDEEAPCNSTIGMSDLEDQPQSMNLGKDCFLSQMTIKHELLHSLGFHHEQRRPDSDDYITIHWENIAEGFEHNFEPLPVGYYFDTTFDIQSIMMYSPFSFSKSFIRYPVVGSATITLKNGLVYCQDFDRPLTDQDKKALNLMYPPLSLIEKIRE